VNPEIASSAIGIGLLGFVYGWGPIVLKMPAVALMWSFPLSRTLVEETSKSIAASLPKSR